MARLSRADRTAMAMDNYRKFSAQAKANRGKPPPITSSSQRQGAGKGDAPRLGNTRKYRKNFDYINWKSRSETKKVKAHTIKEVINVRKINNKAIQ